MSKEGTPELTKSWVVVPPEGNNTGSGVQEVIDNDSHVDSDSDSISVISESGGSYKTDEEEGTPVEETPTEIVRDDSFCESAEAEPEPPRALDLPRNGDKLMYFATSAVCAIVLLGISVAVQRYLQGTSNVNSFGSEQEVVFSQLKNQDERSIKYQYKGVKVDPIPNKMAKLQHDNVKYTYKVKPAKYDKENTHDESDKDDYDIKVKELKVREDFLNEKEKFLIEKEHALLRKEIKLKREEKQERKSKETDDDDDDDLSKKKHNYLKTPKTKTRKPTSAEDKKKEGRKRRFVNEHDKKRNISGQWYINLHEARDNMRQKKYAYFKRNKAHWYFQWMVDRARLRGK